VRVAVLGMGILLVIPATEAGICLLRAGAL